MLYLPAMNTRQTLRIAMWSSALPVVAVVAAQGPPQGPDPLDEPFKGVTASGTVTPGLFPIRSIGCLDGARARRRRRRFSRR